MAKRFKLRICRVISTTLQSCRSKDPSILPQDPVLSFSPQISTLHFPAPSNTGSHPHPTEFKWQKEDKWHVVAKIYEPPHQPRRKIYNSSVSAPDHLTSSLPPPPEKKKKHVKKKKKVLTRVRRLSTSSTDSGWFSSEGGGAAAEEEETETLVSSSISSSSTSRRINNVNKRRGGATPAPPSTTDADIPARLSVLKKLIPCTVDGKVKESYAIVKRSEDPYEDFKNSMMEMILEKQMFGTKDLEQLLQCFLSLNSRFYHGVIIQAFSEIWEDIFFSISDNAGS